MGSTSWARKRVDLNKEDVDLIASGLRDEGGRLDGSCFERPEWGVHQCASWPRGLSEFSKTDEGRGC